ncbi:MAG TPA: hypothetical protein VF783_24320 [Terriglobales bacterium]
MSDKHGLADPELFEDLDVVARCSPTLPWSFIIRSLNWSPRSLLHDFRNGPDQPSVYINLVRRGQIPRLGKEFNIFYSRYPRNRDGWPGATVQRFTVSCL